MPGKTTLILGGGWGGLAVAHYLRGLLPPEHRVVVIERNDTFSLCMSNLWIMTGERSYPSDVERQMSKLANKGIEWVHDDVRRIEPDARAVHTNSGVLQGDYLIIALGATLAPDGVPGFTESAHNLYDAQGVLNLRRNLAQFDGGKVLVLITRTPFRCPAAPYEAAFLLDWLFRKKGIRERVELAVYTPEKLPMPVAGPAVGDALRNMLNDRGIAFHPERRVSRIDSASRKAFFDGEEASYDLLVGVPPHKAPQVVVEAGLTDSTGYIPAHPETLEILSDPDALTTHYPGVFAIGDVTAVRLLNSMFLPKAGVFVEAEARVVAQNVATTIGGEARAIRFDGRGSCYVEVGDGMAAFGSGRFFDYPGPSVTLEPPSAQYRRDKEEFERVLDIWFTR
jgi:sulfide:quinone oxidoreductase